MFENEFFPRETVKYAGLKLENEGVSVLSSNIDLANLTRIVLYETSLRTEGVKT